MYNSISSVAKPLRALHGLPRKWKTRNTLRHVQRILKQDTPPETIRAESSFADLQAHFQPRPEYGYDPLSTWKRGVDRCFELSKFSIMVEQRLTILELGCGDGMLGLALQSFGHKVVLSDLEDWRDARARTLNFVAADSCACLSFDDSSFDLVCSYNSFEHLPDPAAALRHIVRITRPGGLIHLNFGPIYTGPWGLHAYRTLRMPYPQYLFSEGFIRQKLSELGIWDLGKKRSELQHVNKWKVANFYELWGESGCTLTSLKVSRDESGIPLVSKFPEAFRGRGLRLDDITANNITVTLRKP
jgi:SAM-dependent methyltransferase